MVSASIFEVIEMKKNAKMKLNFFINSPEFIRTIRSSLYLKIG